MGRSGGPTQEQQALLGTDTDERVAQACGVGEKTIRTWRKQLGIGAHGATPTPRTDVVDIAYESLANLDDVTACRMRLDEVRQFKLGAAARGNWTAVSALDNRERVALEDYNLAVKSSATGDDISDDELLAGIRRALRDMPVEYVRVVLSEAQSILGPALAVVE